jgi:opacity protein-like surface antigen
MPKLLVIVMMFSIMGAAAQAQQTPRVEVFGGYSLDYASFPLLNGSQDLGNVRGFLSGWNASANFNFNHWFGVAADFAGHYGSPSKGEDILVLPPNCFIGCTGPVTATLHNVHTFTFGPEIAIRQDHFTFFVRALFGAAHTREDIDSFASFVTPRISETKFAMIGDGGVDLDLSPHMALRIQPGYLMTHMLDRRQNSFRFSTGLVFRLGH